MRAAMRRTCEAKHPDPRATAEKCPLCHRAVHDPGYRWKWRLVVTAEGPRPSPAVRARYCPPRGVWDWAVIADGQTADRGSERTWAAAEAEAEAARADLAGEDGPRKEFASVTRRNLLFHLHPVPGRWGWHAEQLRERAGLFDSRRLVAVNVGPGLDPPAAVRAALPGFEVIEVPNNPSLREVATFLPLFEGLLADYDPASVTLYAQSKGVTRKAHETGPRWAEVLYDLYCDHWPLVAESLASRPLAGAFLKAGRGWRESASLWHYSSSWFWFRTDALFALPDWRRIDRFWSGIEPYPSLHFPYSAAGCVFHPGLVPSLDLYSWDYWRRAVETDLGQWRKENADRRTDHANRG